MATTVTADEVPLLVDELPLAALAMAHRAASRVEGAEELRVKESDRVEATAAALRAIGSRIEAREDGWRIRGVPRARAAATSTPRATTGSRCSAPSPGSPAARASSSRARKPSL